MAAIHITDIEAAINHWRQKAPSADGITLAPELHELAEIYAQMVYRHVMALEEAELTSQALASWMDWYQTTPDTPCIAICSTSQGDEVCKGCGRTFLEVQTWTEMQPAQKRQTWRRIVQEGDSLRFNRYAERATESSK